MVGLIYTMQTNSGMTFLKTWASTPLAALLVVLVGCASGPEPVGFTKVKYYQLKDEDARAESYSIDPMIRFERQHHFHGAVTKEQRRDRLGHYYTLFWNAPASRAPVTVRFEYRQSKTGERVSTFDRVVRDVRDQNKTALRITGDSYHRDGRVVAWQATLLQDGKVLDQTRSFLWK